MVSYFAGEELMTSHLEVFISVLGALVTIIFELRFKPNSIFFFFFNTRW